MASEKELNSAMRLALTHDRIRKEVTRHLRWALDTFEKFKERMPSDPSMAEAFDAARSSLKYSEHLTACEPKA